MQTNTNVKGPLFAHRTRRSPALFYSPIPIPGMEMHGKAVGKQERIDLKCGKCEDGLCGSTWTDYV